MVEYRINEHLIKLDDEDANLFYHFKWYISKSRGGRPYVRAFYLDEQNKRKSVFLQHLILGYPSKGQRLIFKDNDSLNLQKSNLEYISCGEFAHLYHKNPNDAYNKKYRGVGVYYASRIKYKNKTITIGFFKSELEAAKAYDKKAVELYGDKAKINIYSQV